MRSVMFGSASEVRESDCDAAAGDWVFFYPPGLNFSTGRQARILARFVGLGFSTWAAGSQILDGQPSHGGWLKIKMFLFSFHFESTLTVATSLARRRKTTRKICNQKEIYDADQLEAELASLELFPIAD